MLYFVGVDVGTSSARAGIFDENGTCWATAVEPIQIFSPSTDFYEQSSDDIWKQCCCVVRSVVDEAHLKLKSNYHSLDEFKQQIKGIGFDATCSLVALGHNGPISVSQNGDDSRNIILWMDHRAVKQSDTINHTKHDVLKYVGDQVSPEMEIPKLLWIKQNLPQTWKSATKFFDLVDFLTFKATNVDVRSICTVACKWNFMAHLHLNENKSGWIDSYFQQIGLEDLVDEQYERIGGNRIRNIGEPIGNGLSEEAAEQLGLNPNTAVSVGMIDAHAGGVGVLGATLTEDKEETKIENRLALISGTSTCHMVASKQPIFCSGIWGPYYGAMIPGMWLTEGGQSATGSLIDHILTSHSKYQKVAQLSKENGISAYQFLNNRLETMAAERNLTNIALLTKSIHVLPYFHGNRSPRADPTLTGMICGLTLDHSIDNLALLYLATVQAIAYGTRHIIEEMNTKGHVVNSIFVTGGSAKNSLYLQQHADITSCSITLAKVDAVLLGSSILGAVASQRFSNFLDAMTSMSSIERIVRPSFDQNVVAFHKKKYLVFKEMYNSQILIRTIMQ